MGWRECSEFDRMEKSLTHLDSYFTGGVHFRFGAEGLPVWVQRVGTWLDEATPCASERCSKEASEAHGCRPAL